MSSQDGSVCRMTRYRRRQALARRLQREPSPPQDEIHDVSPPRRRLSSASSYSTPSPRREHVEARDSTGESSVSSDRSDVHASDSDHSSDGQADQNNDDIHIRHPSPDHQAERDILEDYPADTEGDSSNSHSDFSSVNFDPQDNSEAEHEEEQLQDFDDLSDSSYSYNDDSDEGSSVDELPEDYPDIQPQNQLGQNGVDPPLFADAPLTLRQSMLAVLTYSIVHKLTGVALSDLLSLIAFHCIANNNCIKSLYKFRKYFLQMKSPLNFHYFCSECLSNLPSKDARCPQNCPNNPPVSFFIEISIIEQLSRMLNRPGFSDKLSFRRNRHKKHPDNFEDVYEGRIYKEKVRDGFLSNDFSMSFCWNTDGVRIFKSSKSELYPFYLAINELPYNLRFKKENLIIGGLWLGPCKPSFPLFLNSLHNDLVRLYNGIDLVVHGYDERQRVRATVLCGTCDMVAKAMILNMKQFNGYYGCPTCKQRGERSDRTDHQHAYPYEENTPLRNKEETERHAEMAELYGRDMYGIKGRSALGLYVADYISSTSIDVMHCVYEGVIKKLVNLWFHEDYRNENFSLFEVVDAISEVITLITPPSFVRRLPRSIKEHLSYWKAQEFKSFLFYYSIPVLSRVFSPIYFNHHLLLVHALYLLNQESISEEMIQEEEHCLKQYVILFPDLYHYRYLTINFHMLLHLGNVVRNLGPLWASSCMPFESLNGELKNMVHGTRHAILQISSGLSQIVNLRTMLAELDIGDPIRKWCENMLNRCRLYVNERVTDSISTLGKYTKPNILPPLVAEAFLNANLDGNATLFLS